MYEHLTFPFEIPDVLFWPYDALEIFGRLFSVGYVAALQPNVDNVGLMRNAVLEAAVLTDDIVDGIE